MVNRITTELVMDTTQALRTLDSYVNQVVGKLQLQERAAFNKATFGPGLEQIARSTDTYLQLENTVKRVTTVIRGFGGVIGTVTTTQTAYLGNLKEVTAAETNLAQVVDRNTAIAETYRLRIEALKNSLIELE